MPTGHLDDDVISELVDDAGAALAPDRRDHLEACSTCQARLSRFAEAVELVRTPVTPLDASAVDTMVGHAVDGGTVVPLNDRRARRARRALRTVPPAWLVAVAAAVVLVLGVPALLRSGKTDRHADLATTAKSATVGDAVTSGAAPGGGAGASGFVTATTGTDLGDLASDDGVVTSLRARLDASTSTAGAAEATVGATAQDVSAPAAPTAASARSGASKAPSPSPPAPPTCQDEAAAAGAGTVGALLYYAPARWKGQAAQVFVYAVAAPQQGQPARQAYVMTLPGCAVAAAPRF
jgi:hypothetical protein